MIDILFALVVKHCIIDLGLQSQLLANKTHKKVFYFGCHEHYIHHAIGTFVALYFFTDISMVLLASVIDYLAHWHIDFAKHNINNWLGYTRKDKLFWWVAVVDQLLHFLTYYLLVLYVIS